MQCDSLGVEKLCCRFAAEHLKCSQIPLFKLLFVGNEIHHETYNPDSNLMFFAYITRFKTESIS